MINIICYAIFVVFCNFCVYYDILYHKSLLPSIKEELKQKILAHAKYRKKIKNLPLIAKKFKYFKNF